MNKKLKKAVKGIKSLFKKSKSAFGTALVIAGGLFMASIILEVLPQGLDVIWGLAIGLFITLVGGFLIASDKKR